MTIPYLMNCSHSSDGWCLDCVKRLGEENQRLKRGEFTPEELQDLCHHLPENDYKAFCDGCTAYQQKLFGRNREDDTKNDCRIFYN